MPASASTQHSAARAAKFDLMAIAKDLANKDSLGIGRM
jgi:hypothetical protein